MINKIYLPDIDSANRKSFAEIASCIRDFIEWHEKNNKRVEESELIQLNKLSEVLSTKRRIFPSELEDAPLLVGEKPTLPTLPKKGAKRKAALAKHHSLHQAWLALNRQNAIRFRRMECLKREINDETRIYDGRKRDIIRLIIRGGWPSISIMNWYILPPGFWPTSTEEVERVLPRKSGVGYCPDRILHAESLKPFEIGRGNGDFERYFCFRYEFTSKVLLESADDGNAAYILGGDWKALSRKTKYELIQFHSSDIERVFHRYDSPWRSNIKNALKG
jgi:hypothetical protein